MVVFRRVQRNHCWSPSGHCIVIVVIVTCSPYTTHDTTRPNLQCNRSICGSVRETGEKGWHVHLTKYESWKLKVESWWNYNTEFFWKKQQPRYHQLPKKSRPTISGQKIQSYQRRYPTLPHLSCPWIELIGGITSTPKWLRQSLVKGWYPTHLFWTWNDGFWLNQNATVIFCCQILQLSTRSRCCGDSCFLRCIQSFFLKVLSETQWN